MYFMGVVSAIPPSAVLYVHTFSPARAESPAIARLDFLPSIHVKLSLYTNTEREGDAHRGCGWMLGHHHLMILTPASMPCACL